MSPKRFTKGKEIFITREQLGVHTPDRIRATNGRTMPLDRFVKRAGKINVKAIGAAKSGWHIEGSEFVESRTSHATPLPAFGSSPGKRKAVIAVLDNKPRVYKIPFPGSFEGFPDAKGRKELADRICKIVPAAKLLKIEIKNDVTFFDSGILNEGLVVETHEFVGPRHTGKDRIAPKNLMEERLQSPEELKDVMTQVARSVTRLFKEGILLPDALPENFVKDGKVVKLVDHDVIDRPSRIGKDARLKAFELEELGDSLAESMHRFYLKKRHPFPQNAELENALKKTVIHEIHANLRLPESKKKVEQRFLSTFENLKRVDGKTLNEKT